MVLDAKLFEKNLANTETSPVSAPKSDKFGDVKKCPSCGAMVQSFSTKCADCNYEYRNVEASQSITKFFDKLDEIQSTTIDNSTSKESSSNINLGTILKWIFFYWILIPIRVINFLINKSKLPNWSTTDTRKEELIMNYPIPNSKEDILDFITLSTSRVQSISLFKRFDDKGKYISLWNTIWLKKSEQVLLKAKLSMTNDKETFRTIEQLVNSAIVRNKREEKTAHIVLFSLLAFALLTIIFLITKLN